MLQKADSGSGGSSWVTLKGGWLQGRLRGNCRRRPKRPLVPSNTHFRPKQDVKCVAHISSIVSIDGIACDLVSRNAMLQSPSTNVWEDEMGVSQDIPQGEVLSLGRHRALVAIQERLWEGERVFAFLDDICVFCSPESHFPTRVVCPCEDPQCTTEKRKCGTEEVLSRKTSTSSLQKPESGCQEQWSGEEPKSCQRQGKG